MVKGEIIFGPQRTRDDLNYELIRNKMVYALGIMDERGRSNLEDNSKMLWDSEWRKLRNLLFESYQVCSTELETVMSEEPREELLIWNDMVELHRRLKALRGEERSETSRRLAVAITELEKSMSYYNMMILEKFVG